MKNKKVLRILVFAILVAVLVAGVAMADDGAMFRRNVSKTPDQATERANLNHMAFYVPAQSSDGTVGVPIEYYDAAGALVETRDYAKPLVAVYIDHLPEVEEGTLERELLNAGIYSGMSIGAHDAHAAVSLDDGTTWKRTNLSNSADLSSFTGTAPGVNQGIPYPGDAHNMTFAIAGDKVLVGWISRYCDGGSPLYTFADEDVLALQTAFGLPDLYVRDIWGVAGSQGSVDYTVQGFPEVGEIPYSCVWSARGQLLQDADTGTYDIVWTKAERLTSGRRDANRLEMNADSAAGFMMTWQEDPEGLRPGQGLGPGEGWSGAVVNQQTDLWYSFISKEDFVMVMSDDSDTAIPVDIAEYTGETMPKVAIPMAMPIRLTDNKMCKATGSDLYCYVNFDDTDPYGLTDLGAQITNWDDPTLSQSENSTLCATPISWTNPGGTTLQLCQAEDGRVLSGRVGASRPRVNVQPYDIDGDTVYDNAWVIMGAEESKALGEGSVAEDVEPEDVGKNMWYYSFDLLKPEFVLQGGMLNWPAKDPETGELFDVLTDDFGNEFYETEIARRFSHFSQPIHQIGESGVSAVLIVKQGILNQGGPADIFLRRLVYVEDYQIKEDFDGDGNLDVAEDVDGDGNLDVAEDIDGDGRLDIAEDIDGDGRLDIAEDLNGNGELDDGEDIDGDGNLDVAEDVDGDDNLDVAEDVDGDGNLDVAEDVDGDGNLDVAEELELIFENPYAYENMACENWAYTDGSNPRYLQGLCMDTGINVSGVSWTECDGDCTLFPWEGGVSPFPKVTMWEQTVDNLDDESWENPFDVAKGHRGFIDGDFIMMMYAWSPNWKANSVGNDHYNLYARRSFDGGQTWTTTPATLGGDGTETCENFPSGSIEQVCTTYGAGEFEQARNLSQLVGNKVTILDPRYTPTGGLKMLPISDLKEIGFSGYDDDVRDPSKFFIVYETGDNTTVAEGEAVPMDLFYSRAINWGDEYDLVEYDTPDGIIEGFDWLEHDRYDLSGEAANTANNGGTYYYVIWNQWQEDEHENVSESDAIFRRVMYLDDVEAVPTVKILYVSQTLIGLDETPEDAILLIVGSARDGDHIDGLPLDDIGEIQWMLDGVDVTEFADENDPKRLNYPVGNLHPGWQSFQFKAADKGGRWSPGVNVEIFVSEGTLYRNYLPMYIPEPNIIE